MGSNQFTTTDESLFDIATHVPGPAGSLPLTPEMLRERPSGDLFGWTQNAGMGWTPSALGGREFLILSTHGGIRAPDGTPIALGYHTGHWEVGLLMEAAAHEFKAAGAIPFAASCTDPCDGRSQGTPAMFDSLAYRNDAATIFRRLIRSLPTRSGVLGVATCDKGLPAMMMALAAMHDLPCVLVPGGVTLLPVEGEDAGAGADDRRPLHARRDRRCRRQPISAAAPARRPAAAASSSAPPRRRRSSAKRSGCRSAIPRSRPRDIRSGSTWRAGPRGADGARGARHHDARHPHRRRRCATRWSCTRRSAARPT